MEFLPPFSEGHPVYAGFGRRFCALWVDALILVPISYLLFWVEGLDKYLAMAICVPATALFAMYHVYFNARHGGTPGKLALGIRITKPDGSPIGWPEAWKRSSVDIGFALVMLVLQVIALTRVDNSAYSHAALHERLKLLHDHYPRSYFAVHALNQIWTWSELLVLLCNKRRRALHDFIAGTVVINKHFHKLPNAIVASSDPRSHWPYTTA